MMRVGFIGWRGMVGSVLLERMQTEGDFDGSFEPEFYSTSQVGGAPPEITTTSATGSTLPPLKDAFDLEALGTLDAIVTCQGGSYTKRVYSGLRGSGWRGVWIDAASALRLDEDAVIVLDPVNRPLIDRALQSGAKTFVGGNCTVSLMLMAFGGLFRQGWVEWLSTMTYQAASGGGANKMRELIAQMRTLGDVAGLQLDNPAAGVLELDRAITEALRSSAMPVDQFGVPLAASLIPWIDSPMDDGATREEWKGFVETQRILGLDPPVPVDGVCVRVGAMRCHSQGVTIKLRRDVPLDEVSDAIASTSEWTRVVPNTEQASTRELTPAAVSGELTIPVGRLRKMRMGQSFVCGFTVGDQLLWGAAEPLRRMLRILLDQAL